MPIRFPCPHCHQKLSVSTRKAGREADCPRCKRTLTIPVAEVAGVAVASEESRPPEMSLGGSAAALLAEESVALQSAGSEDLELVYDSSDEWTADAPPPTQPDLIAVPRSVLYLQGGLLAVVALVSFAIGLVAGGAFSAGQPAPAQPQACTLEGTINYASGNRHLPDRGAVVAVVPQDRLKPDEKASAFGLRPSDSPPAEGHRGVAILRELGGGYARTDDKGRFQIRLPDRGKYLVLVISQARQLESPEDVKTADILKLGPFFHKATDLLGQQRYQLTSEQLTSDRRLNVVFD